MARTTWKRVERSAAALMKGKRFPANVGDRADFEGPLWLGQVKNVRRLPLGQLEALALEMERLGFRRGKLGAVIVKRSGGQGRTTPHLVIVSEATWREFTGRMPQDDAHPQEAPCPSPRP